MDNFEDRQREMRERNTRSKREKVLAQPEGAPHHSPEVFRLKKRIAELKEQVSALQLENNRLREQKTIVVERSAIPLKSNNTTSLSTATRENTRLDSLSDLASLATFSCPHHA